MKKIIIICLSFFALNAFTFIDEQEANKLEQILIEKKQAQDAKLNEEVSPFCKAIILKQYNIVNTMIEQHTNTNTTENCYEKTPLVWAVTKNDMRMIQLLISKGADVNLFGNDEVTPLIQAVADGNLQIIDYLLNNEFNKADINFEKRNFTPLIAAVSNGYLNVVSYLVEHGANVNYQIKNNDLTALMFAVDNGDLEIAKYLVENDYDKANMYLTDRNGLSVFDIAREKGYHEVLEYLKGKEVKK